MVSSYSPLDAQSCPLSFEMYDDSSWIIYADGMVISKFSMAFFRCPMMAGFEEVVVLNPALMESSGPTLPTFCCI